MESGLMVLLARGFARESGIEVKTGTEPMTDCKKTIWLPPLSPKDTKANALVLRWLLHETAHINYTSPEVMEAADDCRSVLNALEDIRVEWEKCKELPGAARRFSEGILALKEAGRIGLRDSDSPAAVMYKFLLYKLRADLLGQPLAEEGEQAEKKLAELIGFTKVQKVKVVGRSVLLCSSTSDVLMLARQIARILQEEEEESQPMQPAAGNPGPDSSAEDQDSEAEGTAPSAKEDQDSKAEGNSAKEDEDQDPKAEDNAPACTQNEQTAEDKDPKQGHGACGQEPDAQTVKENIRAILQGMTKEEQAEASLEEAAKQEISRAASRLPSSGVPGSAMPGEGEYDVPKSGDGSSLIKRAREASARLREVFETVIQTETLSHRYHVCHGRRLDSRKLSRLHAGDSRVFLQKTEGRKIDTAIHLAVDISGSMKGRPLSVAKEAAMAVTLALEGMQNVDFSMLAFGSYLYPLKTWGEGLHTAACNLAGVWDGGGTALPEAIMDGLDRLLMVNRPQKILLVATDGQVEGFFNETQDVIRRAREMGILCYGIGICTEVWPLFGAEYSIKIPSVEELPQEMFRLLQNTLFLREAA